MPFKLFDRRRLRFHPLRERRNRIRIDKDFLPPASEPRNLSAEAAGAIDEIAGRMRRARALGRPRMIAFGAHAIKNGLGPLLIRLMEEGWLTHLATNGAGIIHDWEFAYLGESSEDVRANVAAGTFGIWEETGFYINLALAVGAWEGLGYGESIGAMVHRRGLVIPAADELVRAAVSLLETDPERAAAAADLLSLVRAFNLPPGTMKIAHPFGECSVQAAAFRLGVPLTGHPMIGHDIIYTHPINSGAAVGRTALRDFLTFAESISRLEDGIYISIGSAVMSPMIFEKSLSMAQNLCIREDRRIERHFIAVADLSEASWDWQAQGEPPPDNPAYYLRYCKTFSRMGGTMRYVCADNRDFLPALRRSLDSGERSSCDPQTG